MPADCSSSTQLRECKELEAKKNHETLASHRLQVCSITVDQLTSKRAAQGAGTASNVVPVTEHVIGLASYRVWYAAGYASSITFIISNGSGLEAVGGEKIL